MITNSRWIKKNDEIVNDEAATNQSNINNDHHIESMDTGCANDNQQQDNDQNVFNTSTRHANDEYEGNIT